MSDEKPNPTPEPANEEPPAEAPPELTPDPEMVDLRRELALRTDQLAKVEAQRDDLRLRLKDVEGQLHRIKHPRIFQPGIFKQRTKPREQ